MKKRIFLIKHSAVSYCPVCGEPLIYRDTCKRIVRLEGRESRVYAIRWHHRLMVNQLRMNGYLKSAGYRLLGFSEELLKSGMPLLEALRSSNPEWLEAILRLLYNSGEFLEAV